jgi:hypothetical protein
VSGCSVVQVVCSVGFDRCQCNTPFAAVGRVFQSRTVLPGFLIHALLIISDLPWTASTSLILLQSDTAATAAVVNVLLESKSNNTDQVLY